MNPPAAMFGGRQRILLLLWLAVATGAMLVWTVQQVTPAEDLRIYLRSLDQALAGGNPYYPFQIGSFIYHPLVLTLLTPFASVTWPWAWAIWTVLTVSAWLGSIHLSLQLAEAAGPAKNRTLAVSSVVVGSLLAGPFIETAYSGQINVFVVLAVCFAFTAAERGRPAAAGASLAFAVVLKTSPVLLLAHFISVRQYRVVFYCLAATAIFSVVPVAQFGQVLLTSFVDVVQQINATVRVNRFNVGLVAGFYVALRRLDLMTLGAEFWRGVGYGTAALLGGIALRNWFGGTVQPSQRVWSFALVLTVLTVLSPLVWYHHLVFLLLPVLLVIRSSPVWVGVLIVTLLQSQRLFESAVWGFPAPVLAAQGLTLCVMFWMWFRSGMMASEVQDSRTADV